MKTTKLSFITIEKSRASGHTTPGYIELAQRHFEKAVPEGKERVGKEVAFTAPIDLLGLTIKDQEALNGIEEVTLVYERA